MNKIFKNILIIFFAAFAGLLIWYIVDDRTPGETPKASYYDQQPKNDSAFIKAKERLNDSIQ